VPEVEGGAKPALVRRTGPVLPCAGLAPPSPRSGSDPILVGVVYDAARMKSFRQRMRAADTTVVWDKYLNIYYDII
jgi:hypothetical protein